MILKLLWKFLPIILLGNLFLISPGLCQKSGSERLLAEGDGLLREFKFTEAEARFREALKTSEAAGDKGRMAQSLEKLGGLHADLGNYAGAIEVFQQARKIYGDLNQKAGEVRVQGALAQAYEDWGDSPGAIHHFKQAMRGPAEAAERARWSLHLGKIYWRLGDDDECVRHLRTAHSAAREVPSRKLSGELLLAVGEAFQEAGHSSEAKTVYHEVLQQPDAALAREGRIHLGDLAWARKNLDEAEALYSQAQYSIGLGRIALARQKYDAALAAFRQGSGDQLQQAFAAQAGLGLAYLGQNQYSQAESHFRRSTEALENLRDLLPVGKKVFFLADSTHGFHHLGVYEALITTLNLQGKQAEAFKMAEYTRSRVLTEALMSKVELPRASKEAKEPEPARKEARQATIEVMPLGKISRFLQNPTSYYDSSVSSLIVTAVLKDFDRAREGEGEAKGSSTPVKTSSPSGAKEHIRRKLQDLKQKGIVNHLTTAVEAP